MKTNLKTILFLSYTVCEVIKICLLIYEKQQYATTLIALEIQIGYGG